MSEDEIITVDDSDSEEKSEKDVEEDEEDESKEDEEKETKEDEADEESESDVEVLEFSLSEEEIDEWISNLIKLKKQKQQVTLEIDSESELLIHYGEDEE